MQQGFEKTGFAGARVAREGRIYVEGKHDAELVEKVWGHDLRVEGVVVEYLEGLDNLQERLDEFQPGPGRRIGVLADHLIEGTKESRLVENVGPHVLVTGHPYIDIWAAVKPASGRITSLGIGGKTFSRKMPSAMPGPPIRSMRSRTHSTMVFMRPFRGGDVYGGGP